MERDFHVSGGSGSRKSAVTPFLEVKKFFKKLNNISFNCFGSAVDNSCLQYFSGVSGTIKSFNYDGVNGRQLSNQDYSICIRTESNFCGIAYTTCPMGSFSITGPSGGSQTTPGTAIGALVN